MDKVYEINTHFCENRKEEVLTARLPGEDKSVCLCSDACGESCELSEKTKNEG